MKDISKRDCIYILERADEAGIIEEQIKTTENLIQYHETNIKNCLDDISKSMTEIKHQRENLDKYVLENRELYVNAMMKFMEILDKRRKTPNKITRVKQQKVVA